MNSSRRSRSLVPVIILVLPFFAQAKDSPFNVDFNRQIRPILSESCYQCHGPDVNKRKADLRLDMRDGLFKSAEGTTIVVPGKPEESELFVPDQRRRPRAPHAAAQEPDARLTAEQIDLIKRWIAEGAQWKGHWAYLPPTRPAVPVVPEPPAPANDIDRFIRARLARRAPHARSAGRPEDADSPPQFRPDRPAADARGSRGVCQ